MTFLFMMAVGFVEYVPVLWLALTLFRCDVRVYGKKTLIIAFFGAVVFYIVRFQYGLQSLGGPVATLVNTVLWFRFLFGFPLRNALLMTVSGFVLAVCAETLVNLLLIEAANLSFAELTASYGWMALSVTLESALTLLIVGVLRRMRWGFSFLSARRPIRLRQNVHVLAFIVCGVLVSSLFLELLRSRVFDPFMVFIVFTLVVLFGFYSSMHKERED
ncbi:hypothetical protein B5M42_008800 [Paenibacillus athensensis]|uniref:Uncharacterized protein n=1 Tax=Paenibacillus athensensis TaxID=1967502 RepID=A0A4Y8Q973_9BACL|nr:hypothetical protein [Paenibacillus athensensis]MCD1258934.1 hypothetical protein [Paenibacillus athensensis]